MYIFLESKKFVKVAKFSTNVLTNEYFLVRDQGYNKIVT